MELKDIITAIGVVIAAIVGIIQFLKYRHDVRSRREDAEPRAVKPYVNATHTVSRTSFTPETHSLRLEVSNREQRTIAIKEISWFVKSFGTRWPVTYTSLSLASEVEALHQYKIETADLLEFDIDITNVFNLLCASRNLPLLDLIVGISTLQICVILTTGELIFLNIPWTFRSMLATQFIRPSWLAPLVRFYAWCRP